MRKNKSAIENPFQGLSAFKAGKEDLFFGREIHIEQMLNRLAKSSFLAIIGNRGSGKSSLVKCGLLPALHDDFRFDSDIKWRTLLLRPGENPIDSLADMLAKDGILYAELGMEEIYRPIIKKTLRNSPSGLAEAIKQADLPENHKFLIIIDQFEELFRYSELYSKENKKDESARFINLILEASQQNIVPINLVLTLRFDFLGECTKYTGLPELINDGQYLMPRMADEEIKFTIKEPIATKGVEMSEAFVDMLVEDYKKYPDKLILLQHALMRTWNVWANSGKKKITVEHYYNAGTINNALEIHAEEIFAQLKEERKKRICEKIFVSLIDIIAENQYKRRLCRIKEICNLTNASFSEVVEIINLFRKKENNFIIPASDVSLNENSIIDLASEVIILKWGRLRKWLSKEKKASSLYLKLVEAKKMYDEGKSELWRGLELKQAMEWKAKLCTNQTWAKRYDDNYEQALDFLNKSIKKYEAEKKSKNRLLNFQATGFFLIIFGLVCMLAVGLGIMAWNKNQAYKAQQKLSEQKQKIALSNKLVYLARDLVDDDPTIALRLAQKAKEFSPDSLIDNTITEIYSGNNFYKNITKESGDIKDFALSKNEKYIAIATGNIVTIQDLSGSVLQEFNGHNDKLTAVLFSPVGNQLATASKDKSIIIWDLTGKKLKILRKHKDRISAIAYSPDGKHFLSASWDGSIILWDENYEKKTSIQMDYVRFNHVCFSPEGKYILAATSTNKAYLWNLNGELISEFSGHEKEIKHVSFSPLTGEKILTASDDRTVKIWNINGKLLQTLSGHEYSVNCAGFSPDEKYILSGASDNSIRMWDLNGNEYQKFNGHTEKITNLKFLSDNKHFISSSFDGTIKLWNYKKNNFFIFSGHTDEISAVSFSPTIVKSEINEGFLKFHILASSWDNTVRLWNIWGEALAVISGHTGKINAAVFSADGKYILTAADDHTACLWTLKGEKKTVFAGHKNSVLSLAISPDGKYVLTGSLDNTLGLWNMKGELLKVFTGHHEAVTSVMFSPDGKTILSGSKDKTARLWDLSGKQIRMFIGHTAEIASVDFSPNGQFVATASRDNTARIWNVEKQENKIFKGHTSYVDAVAFSPDGNYIVTGSLDKTARLWSVNGKVLQIFRGHSEYVRTLAFSPDGKFVLSGSADNTVRLWEIETKPDTALQNIEIEPLDTYQMLK